ncbi:MAG TPA: hypothetical protein VGK21_03765, partial [Candidatus Angelobacter sp.]
MWPNPNHAWEVELKRQRHKVTAMSGRNFDIALLTGAVWRSRFFDLILVRLVTRHPLSFQGFDILLSDQKGSAAQTAYPALLQ